MEAVIDQGPEQQIEPPRKDEAWEVMNNKSPGEDNISAELNRYRHKNYGKKFTH